MGSVSDIVDLLDQVPEWKALRALPARVEALEKQVAALSAKKDKPTTPCPTCGASMDVKDTKPAPLGATFGKELWLWKCSDAACTQKERWLPGDEGGAGR